MRRERWLFFSHLCCASYMTGSEYNLLMMLREVNTAHDCLLAVPSRGMLAEEAEKLNIPIIVTVYPMLVSLWRPSEAFHAELEALLREHALSLYALMQQEQPDRVVVNAAINPLPAAVASSLGIPVIWLITEIVENNRYTPNTVQYIGERASCIVGISRAVLAPWNSSGYADKATLLSPPYRFERMRAKQKQAVRQVVRAELKIAPTAPLVGFLAADLVPHKGLEHFIRMALQLCQRIPDIHFVISGHVTDPQYREHVGRLLVGDKHADRFRFTDYQQEAKRLYAAIDVLIVPSLLPEGFGMTAMEGLCSGVPVIAYRSGGIAEILTDTGLHDYLVQPGDHDALARKAASVLHTLGEQGWPGEQVAHKALSLYSMQRYRQSLSSLYKHKAIQLVRREEGQLANKLPDGIVVKGTAPTIYLLEDGYKRPFANVESFHFYRFRAACIVDTEEHLLYAIPNGRPIDRTGHYIPNAPGQLLVYSEHTPIYLWSRGRLHPISPELSLRLGIQLEDAVSIPSSILDALPKGAALASDYLAVHGPLHGKLYRSSGGQFYYAENGLLRAVKLESLLRYFRWSSERAIGIAEQEVQVLPKGPPILA